MANPLGVVLKGKKVGMALYKKGKEAITTYKQSKSKSNWVKDKAGTITGVKAMSGKIPAYVGAGGKDPAKRADIVKTHFSLKRSEKINKAEKKVKEGKAELKKMVDTGQAEEYSNMPGVHKKKGFK
tara:strand:+ start:96 stop:473 length:378 start_codon:yes stop_codon:yes gene_type:complete